MRVTLAISGLILVALLGWWIGSNLSHDAVGVASGAMFGIIAGLPATMMITHNLQEAVRNGE